MLPWKSTDWSRLKWWSTWMWRDSSIQLLFIWHVFNIKKEMKWKVELNVHHNQGYKMKRINESWFWPTHIDPRMLQHLQRCVSLIRLYLQHGFDQLLRERERERERQNKSSWLLVQIPRWHKWHSIFIWKELYMQTMQLHFSINRPILLTDTAYDYRH